MINLQVDRALECVKNIVDNNRCSVCDTADGLRMRYACGHTACNNCVIAAEECLLCTPPPPQTSSYKVDDVFTQRVQNSSALLKACQELFNTDVYKHQRLSEQMRIERELFPQCIQAPIKYENKRKSIIRSPKGKENLRSVLPGEEISFTKENKMNNSLSYVQQWLNRNDGNISRKPFTDLNINHQVDQPNDNISKFSIKTVKTDLNKICSSPSKKKKIRSHYKTVISPNQSCITRKRKLGQNPNNSSKKVKDEIYQEDEITEMQNKNDNDESGIVVDIDETIVINDTQETVTDKDKDAWLAVLEADKRGAANTLVARDNTDFVNRSLQQKLQSPNNNLSLKVPFYKKSYLEEKCKYCNDDPIISQSKEAKIIIECNNFLTTITVFNTAKTSTKLSKTLVPEQPKQSDVLEINKQLVIETPNFIKHQDDCKKENEMLPEAYETQSEDLFVEQNEHIGNISEKTSRKKQQVTIEDSDSDGDIENSGPMHVTVDIHRSCKESEYGVLAEVANQGKHAIRPRRAPRGHTPASTESSEKENYNPNRKKRNKFSKKKSKK